jgi:multicomponent Na+:H+ antiporter subunit E
LCVVYATVDAVIWLPKCGWGLFLIRAFSLGIFLAGIWLLLSGHYTPLILAFGAGSVVLVVWIARRMDVIDNEGHPVHLTWQAPRYWAWLAWQIVLSNIAVARAVLATNMPIDPRMIEVDAPQSDDLGRVTYANAITLTPGTVSTRMLPNGRILVHALTAVAAEDLESGAMARRTKGLTG